MEQEESPAIKPVTQCRMAVVERVYYQEPHEQPDMFESRFERVLATDDQPVSRRATAPLSPEAIYTGWLKHNVSMIVVKNHAGENLAANPSPEEREAIERQVIYLACYGVTAIEIKPGCSVRFSPLTVHDWTLWAANPDTKYSIYIVPR